jgi:3-oxoacyl-[acyl-carrier-protein] synthase-3
MIGIEAIGTYLPQERVSNLERLEKFGLKEEFIHNKVGFSQLSKKSADDDTSDLCVKAFHDLIGKLSLRTDEIDCIAVCTQNPDGYGLPHTSAIVHEKLSLPTTCAAFDISLGCSGYVYGLSILKSFMASNHFQRGLFFTADPYSKIIDYDDKNTSILFGDGAAVTLLGSNPIYDIGEFVFGTDGSKRSFIVVEDKKLKMSGRGVYSFAVKNVPGNILEMLKRNGLPLEKVDKFILHQGSLFIINALVEELKVKKEQCPFTAEDYGNTVSSSIPIILATEIENQQSKNLVLSGFGVGMSWASTLLKRVD